MNAISAVLLFLPTVEGWPLTSFSAVASRSAGKVPAGGFQNFKDGLGWEKWHSDLGRQTLTAAEEYDLRKKLASAERERAEKAQLDAATAEKRAQSIWARARQAGDHPYLAKKKIKAYGTRIFKCFGGLVDGIIGRFLVRPAAAPAAPARICSAAIWSP